MKIIHEKVTLQELEKLSEKMFGELVKAVVDIKKEIMAIDAELHSDLEGLLLEHESQQEDLWGINIYPKNIPTGNWVEFDSMINLRPSQGNTSRNVDNPDTRKAIIKIVTQLVVK